MTRLKDFTIFKLGYEMLKTTGSARSLYTEKPLRNIIKQDLIACKIYNS